MDKENDVQNIRRSQYIYTYGPGAIIESVNGPRLIPKLSIGMPNFRKIVKNYKVNDSRLKGLFQVSTDSNTKFETRFFNIPSNSSLGKETTEGLCKTYIFPAWKICYGNHDNNKSVLYKSSEDFDVCPVCRKSSDTHVRFICACPDGHMDELPWYDAVHYKLESSCRPDYFIWDANGSSLSDIKIKCPKCGEEKNMEQIYKQNHLCTCRYPEREMPTPTSDRNNVCYPDEDSVNRNVYPHKMNIIQRQSTSLRIANTTTLLRIPQENNSKLYDLFEDDLIKMFMMMNEKSSEEQFLDSLNSNDLIPEEDKKVIRNYIHYKSYHDFREKYENYTPGDVQYDLDDIKLEEYEYMLKPHTGELEIGGSKVSEKYPFLQVAPVHKISLITAQTSYERQLPRRKGENEGERMPLRKNDIGEVDIRPDGKFNWYPVYDSYGEGLFISNSNLSEIDIDENITTDWINSFNNDEEDQYRNPYYVWWHTLSHALIRTLSYNAGYSSASIRERIYFNPLNNNGGILLYTTSTGEDGSMGGLVGMADKFDDVLSDALNLISNCSYDPLCSSSKISKEKVNGAACIYCLLLPETSCECNNKWLDKHVLLNE